MKETFEEWVAENADEIIEIYLEDSPEAPEDIYEAVAKKTGRTIEEVKNILSNNIK